MPTAELHVESCLKFRDFNTSNTICMVTDEFLLLEIRINL